MTPLVSIIVPVYNMGDRIETCVKSLMEQEYPNVEILLIDDGSKDDSLNHCRNLELQDSRIHVFHTENQGSGPARNYGIEHANGEYVYFPDADDYLEKEAIGILVYEIKKQECDLVVFGYKNVGTSGNQISIKDYPEMFRDGEIIRNDYADYIGTTCRFGIQGAPWNKFFSMSVIREHDITYPSLRRHQDEGFIARYMGHVTRVHFIPDVLYTYYTNDLNREWDKYPTTYIDAVIGLFEERKTNVLVWNFEDKRTHDMVYNEYICGVIKALELSFSPKFGFSKTQRKKWIENTISRTQILSIYVPDCLGKYQSIALKLIKSQSKKMLYTLLKIKVSAEKNGIIYHLKKATR